MTSTFGISPASSFAGDIDNVVTLIFFLVGFWLLACEFMFFYLLWRFRAKEGQAGQYVTGDEPHLHRWISIPHALVLVCDVFIVIGAVRVWYNVKQSLPPADATIGVVAQQWAWTFVHPGPDNQLGTADDIATVNELHLQVDKTYHFKLTAKDVLHSFSVPAFRLKQDAIPGREITGWFKTTRSGTFDIQCAEICGIGHGLMPATLVVEDAAGHAAWLSQHTNSFAAVTVP